MVTQLCAHILQQCDGVQTTMNSITTSPWPWSHPEHLLRDVSFSSMTVYMTFEAEEHNMEQEALLTAAFSGSKIMSEGSCQFRHSWN